MSAEGTAPLRLLALAGSLRTESLNRRLVREAAVLAGEAGAEVEQVDLRELALPVYDGDRETDSGLPEGAVRLREAIRRADGLLIASPEYNNSIPGPLKNAIDWVSRPPEQPLRDHWAALMGASPGRFGAVRALVHLRQVLAALGVWVVPGQVAIPRARDAFDDTGRLREEAQRRELAAHVGRLLNRLERLRG